MDHGKRDRAVLQPEELCTKKGERVLRTKNPESRPPTASSLDPYPDCPPELVHVEITDDMLTEVAGQLYGGAGQGGTDSVSLQHWLLRFGAASMELRLIVADFSEWLSNGRLP